MLFMIVEHFRDGDPAPVYRRFRDKGRMAPEGLRYVSSWVTQDLGRCYQVMECDDRALLAGGAVRVVWVLPAMNGSMELSDGYGMILSRGEARGEDLHRARRGPLTPTAVRVTLAGGPRRKKGFASKQTIQDHR